MKIVVTKLRSISPYSQSKHYQTPKLEKESAGDYEKRTWRDRCHANEEGYIYMPPMAFKKAIAEAASFLSEKIEGRGKATYTKHFRAGILVMEPLVLPIKKMEVDEEWLFVPSDGKPGGSTRVEKCFPLIHEWSGSVTWYVLDEIITQPIFERHLSEAGSFIGVGRFRPIRGGYYGRFVIEEIKWDV